jgi:hypothetical protein
MPISLILLNLSVLVGINGGGKICQKAFKAAMRIYEITKIMKMRSWEDEKIGG